MGWSLKNIGTRRVFIGQQGGEVGGIHISCVSQTKKCRIQRTLNPRAWEEKRLNLLGRKWENWKKGGLGEIKKATWAWRGDTPFCERQREEKEWQGKCRTVSEQEKDLGMRLRGI